MIPIKIQCGCGQRYAFDAEPVNGRLAAPVNCPTCGMEGTAAANDMITQMMPPPVVTAPASGMRLHVSGAEASGGSAPRPTHNIPASAPNASQLGLVDRNQAEVEARAKVSWGDPPEAVLKYLMIQSFTHEEASALVNDMFKERAVEVRKRGVRKILIGCGMIVAAGSGIGYLLTIKLMLIKIMGVLFAISMWGLWNVINGIIMVALPKMQSGDVAEQ